MTTVRETLKQIFHSILIVAGAGIVVVIVLVGIFLYRYEVQPRLRLGQMERELTRLSHPVGSELLWGGSDIGSGGGSMDIAILYAGELRHAEVSPEELIKFYEDQEVSLRFVVKEELVNLQPAELDFLPWGFPLTRGEGTDELWQSLPEGLPGTVYLVFLNDMIYQDTNFRALR